MAGVAAMSMYHQYRMYRSMMMYNAMGGMGGGYGYGNSPYGYGRRGMLLDEFDCRGGCPMNAFCDYGICRCRTGYDARYGQCWNRMDDFNGRQSDWNLRQQSDFNPYKPCNTDGECRLVDMNMICNMTASKTCQCRDDMKWNDEALECQVFIDVDCSSVKSIETIILNGTTPDGKEVETFDDSGIYNLTQTNGTLNVSEITADETLESSELTKLDPNNTSPDEIKQTFCKDMARVTRSYEQRLVEPPPKRESTDGSAGVGIIVLIVMLIILCCACVCIYKFCSKIKEAFTGGSKNEDYNMTSSHNDIGFPPPAMNTGFPPPDPNVGFPPPQAPLYPQIQPDPGLPPLGPAIPPTQPGYPSNPYPPNDAAPYPPMPDAGGPPPGLPYPVAPPGGAPPPYPPINGVPPYPPTGGAPPYPTQPPFNPTA